MGRQDRGRAGKDDPSPIAGLEVSPSMTNPECLENNDL